MLKQRVITALFLVLLIGTAVYALPYQGFVIFACAVFSLAAWEWTNLAGLQHLPSRLTYVIMVLALLALALNNCGLWYDPGTQSSPQIIGQANSELRHLEIVLLAACLWWLLALACVIRYPSSAKAWGSRTGRAVIGLFVLVPSCLALIYLRGLEHGLWWFAYLIAVVCAADTGAYFTGNTWGKKKLAPHVSPNKSWEGFWGGVASTCLLAVMVGSLVSFGTSSFGGFVAITMFTGVASVLGDLFESMIKRHRGIKDSSQILPGHGGVLDRMDSVTAATPVFALFVIYTS